MKFKAHCVRMVLSLAALLMSFEIVQAQFGTELVYYELNKPRRNLNPLSSGDIKVIRMDELMFDALYSWDDHGEAVPQMAQSMPTLIGDSTQALIILKNNLLWPDSAEITVEDVLFTFGFGRQFPRFKDSRRGLELIRKVKAGEAPNSVIFEFRRQVNHPERLLANMYILPKHVISNSKELDQFSEVPRGAGPFQLKDMSISTNSYHFEKNPSYGTISPGRPYIDRIKMNYWSSKTAWVLNILQGGVVDVLPDMEYNTELRNKPQINTVPVNTNTVAQILFNMRDPILSNQQVRQGLEQLISRNEIYEKIYFGDSTNVLTGPYTPSSPFCNFLVPAWAYNSNQAHALFEQSGLLSFDGTKVIRKDTGKQWQLTIITYITAAGEQDNLRKALEAINEYFRSGGIDSKIEYRSSEGYVNALQQGDFQLIYLQVTFEDNFDIEPFYSQDAINRPGGHNYGAYSRSDVNQAFKELLLANVPQKQRALGHKIHELLHDDPPAMFLWNIQKYAYFRSELQDISVDPFYFFSTVDSWVKKPE